jgi:uncharacterized protein (TIGR02145 family)
MRIKNALKKNCMLVSAILLFTLQGIAQITVGDTIIDSRTGIKYPTIVINGTTWMTKNMNVGTMVQNTNQTDNNILEKTCYDNDSTNCTIYGGLYTYNEAMMYDSLSIQGICPDCWHVATKEDWEELLKISDSQDFMQQLKVSKQNTPPWDGNNATGFSALPAGLAYDNVFGRKGDWAIFWTSTPTGKHYAWSIEMDNFYPVLSGHSHLMITNTYLKKNAFSVRCVKNKK